MTRIRVLPALAGPRCSRCLAAAASRPGHAARDGRPNILVVMTDDQSMADVAKMPNVRKLLARKGTTFANAIDSFPLCCPCGPRSSPASTRTTTA